MDVIHLQIVERDNSYMLVCGEQDIKCLFSDDYVSSDKRSLIEHVRDDFDRCGELGIEENIIQTNGIACAYNIFSIQKFKVENKKIYKDLLRLFNKCLKLDFSLISVGYGPLEAKEIERLWPVREAIKEQIGESAFNDLTEYAWGSYYYQMNAMEDGEEYDGPGKFITDDAFKDTDVSKVILKSIQMLSIEDTACLSALLEVLEYRSILLPLLFLKGDITKSEFISGSMTIAGNVLALAEEEGTNESHQESFNYYSNAANDCINYSKESKKDIDISSSLNNLDTRTNLSSELSPLLCEESIKHEFKAALRVPYPFYPEPSVDEKGQQQFKLKGNVFKSKKEIHNHLEFIIMKTIASFLNTAGGTLVIGVHEYANKKNVVGIDREEFESSDHYVRHLIQVLNNAFNAVIVSRFITVAIEEINGIEVCVVRCKEDTGGEVFYLKDSVYVRTGPRIDQLSTKEVVDLYKEKTRSSHDNTS